MVAFQEQKLSDIANCLVDVLKCSMGDTSTVFVEGREYLHFLLRQLSIIRGKESRYLRPLLAKADSFIAYSTPLPTDPPTDAPPVLPDGASGGSWRTEVIDGLGEKPGLRLDYADGR